MMRITLRATLIALAALILSVGNPALALSAPRAVLRAALTPNQLGSGTTVHFNLHILRRTGETVLPPATDVSLFYPAGFGIATSDLGLETCNPRVLEDQGVEACPRNSRLGYGDASIDIPLDGQILRERAALTTLMGPIENGNLGLLFCVDALSPVGARFVFHGALLPAKPPYGGQIVIRMPLIPVLWTGQYAALKWMRGSLGPDGLLYFRRTRHNPIPYRPTGIRLPDVCPKGGFPFAASVTLHGSGRSTARTTVGCPR